LFRKLWPSTSSSLPSGSRGTPCPGGTAYPSIYQVTGFVFQGLAVLTKQLLAGIAEIEIQLSIRTKRKRMDGMVVLFAADVRKKHFFVSGLSSPLVSVNTNTLGLQDTITLLPKTATPNAAFTSLPWLFIRFCITTSDRNSKEKWKR
jgi:hypothetical protein